METILLKLKKIIPNYQLNSRELESTKEKGRRGETIAAEFLESKGYVIKKRNFHFGKNGEIDIIAEKDNELAFVEVKFRTSRTYGDPLESITPKKAHTLRRIAEGYLYVNKITDMACRIDIIIVDFRNDEPEITHLENAVY